MFTNARRATEWMSLEPDGTCADDAAAQYLIERAAKLSHQPRGAWKIWG